MTVEQAYAVLLIILIGKEAQYLMDRAAWQPASPGSS